MSAIKGSEILLKEVEGHDFPCKFQLILEEVENDQEQLPFIFVHNITITPRFYGLESMG